MSIIISQGLFVLTPLFQSTYNDLGSLNRFEDHHKIIKFCSDNIFFFHYEIILIVFRSQEHMKVNNKLHYSFGNIYFLGIFYI